VYANTATWGDGIGADDLALVLGYHGQDVDGQLICVRIIDRHELHTGIHQGRYECQVAGQAVELGIDENDRSDSA
jgi:hypothetical protein